MGNVPISPEFGWLPPIADVELELPSPEGSKGESALKRRRSSDSLLSESTGNLKALVQKEITQLLSVNFAPCLTTEVDNRFRSMQELNQNSITTANNALSQVPQPFEQLRHVQLLAATEIGDNRAKI